MAWFGMAGVIVVAFGVDNIISMLIGCVSVFGLKYPCLTMI